MKPEEIREFVNAKRMGLWWFGVDIDTNNERIIAAGAGEDLDFPELWVIFVNGDEPIRLDRDDPGIDLPRPDNISEWAWHGHYDLINQSLGPVFWAENGKDVIWMDEDRKWPLYIKVDDSVWAITGFVNDHDLSAKEQEKSEIVGFWR